MRSQATGKSLKKNTQNYYLIVLRGLLEYFVEKDIPSLPPSKIKSAKDKDEKKITFLNPDQIYALLDAPKTDSLVGKRDKAILEAFFSTGLRLSELSALDRDQIRIKPGIKHLEIPIKGKGDRIRPVYFNKRSQAAISGYLNARTDKDPALFVNHGKRKQQVLMPGRISNRAVELVLKKYTLAAGLPVNVSPHTLRHSFATDMLNKGVDIRMVQEFLGHKNIMTTMRYTQVTNKKLREIHEEVKG